MQWFKIILVVVVFRILAGCSEHAAPDAQQNEIPIAVPLPEPKALQRKRKLLVDLAMAASLCM